ncbi:MAG: hypothetical protein HRU75_12885 [Planctomycetia bacterium]|nr:MAG: hypothetical protein HRU75_12885 [Planctomycetia bacterium]
MRRTLHILANSTLLLAALGGIPTESAFAQTRTSSAQSVSRVNDFWKDANWSSIIENSKVHHGSAVQRSATVSGYAFTAEAAAAIAARGEVSAAAMARVRNDMVLVEALVRSVAASHAMGSDAESAALADRVAARLAASSGPAADEANRDLALTQARRAAEKQISREAGVAEAASAAGGLRNLMEVAGSVQLLGGDANPQDPAFANELRRSSREHIVARAAANGFGLPPDLANRHASDILKDTASLQSLGADSLADPAIHNDLRRMGWHMVIRRQALRSLGLPDDAIISAHPGEILRQGAKLQGLNADHTDPRSYDVLRNMEAGRLSEANGKARLQAIADANGFVSADAWRDGILAAAGRGGGDQSGNSGNGQPGTGSGSGGSSTGGAGSGTGGDATSGTRPPLPGSGGSSGSSSGGSGSTPSAPPAQGASGSSGSGQGGSGGDSTTALGDGNVDIVVRVTHNADGSYTATAMMCDGGGTCETVGSPERFTDADGDGSYEGDKGGSSQSKPAEGDYLGDLDDDTNSVNYSYEEDGAANDSESGAADPPADDSDAAGRPSPERRYWLGAMQSYSVIMIANSANAEGNIVALMAGDFIRGTGNSTPTPDGGVFYTRPTGDVPIRDYLSNPGTAQPPPPSHSGPAPTPTPDPNRINPLPDSSTGGPPIQMPVFQEPRPVPGVGGSAPAPTPRR